MSDQKPETPQDADLTSSGPTSSIPTSSTQHLPAHEPGTTAWTTWVPASEQHHAPAPSWSPAPDGTPWTPPPLPESTEAAAQTAAVTAASAPTPAQPPAATSTHQGTARQARPQVTYLPPPSGPNWGLVVVGLIFGLVGAGVVANQVTGFQVADLSELGPSVLVVVGLACALLGLIGIVTRRRRG
ncbi:MAG TPA: hypothetical protein VIE19_04530 [Lapillicoccus sp.]|jgi:hypothetical protein